MTRVRPDGAVEVVARTGGGPNGMAIGPDGAFYVCNNGGFTWPRGERLAPPADARRPTTPAAASSASIRRPARSAVSTTAAARISSAVPTTSSSTATAASTSPTPAGCATRERDHGGVYYAAGRRLADRARSPTPCSRPTASASRPTARVLYVAETGAGAALGLRHPRAGRGRSASSSRPRSTAAAGDRARRLPALRQPRGRAPRAISASPRWSLAASPWSRPRAGCVRAREDARPLPDQHLLRRPRPAHRLRHPVPDRPAGRDGLARGPGLPLAFG